MKRILAIILAAMLLMAGTALADEARLVVNGSGSVYMQADRVSASLGVTLNGEDLAQVQKAANETVSAICAALQVEGLEENEISTNYIYISPRYDYSADTERIVGYAVNNSLTIHTEEIDRIGAFIDAAFAAGANTFDSISFSVSDDSEARSQALALAVQDAHAKAEAIAAAAGKALGEIEEINETSSNEAYYNSASGGIRYAMAESAAYDVGTTVRAAQINVTAKVEITYEMK